MIEIKRGKPEQAQLLSQLALRSKAHWGYEADFMAQCLEELSHSSDDLNNLRNCYYTAEFEGSVAGFYKLSGLDKPKIKLEALFIEPMHIGKGIGKSLIEHAKSIAQQHGGKALILQSDPFAEAFYLSMGGVTTGQHKSGSIAGRFLPMVKITL